MTNWCSSDWMQKTAYSWKCEVVLSSTWPSKWKVPAGQQPRVSACDQSNRTIKRTEKKRGRQKKIRARRVHWSVCLHHTCVASLISCRQMGEGLWLFCWRRTEMTQTSMMSSLFPFPPLCSTFFFFLKIVKLIVI